MNTYLNRELYWLKFNERVLAGKSGQEKLSFIPWGTGVTPRLIGVHGQPGAYTPDTTYRISNDSISAISRMEA